MFLKSLKIAIGDETIRDIPFKKGINLIVDESPEQVTGNNVGKTTVLKLIDFCLGANPKHIYVDPESKKDEYLLVKNFLVDNKVLVTLILTDNLDSENANDIKIERNFLSRNNIVRRINGKNFTEEEFEPKLCQLIFPNHYAAKPTFRQIISHNIRHRDETINNTLKTLDKYTSDAEYETLYLYLLGCEFLEGDSKHELLAKLKQEEVYKARLEKNQTKTAYQAALGLIENEIKSLNNQKANLNLNENFEIDLNNFNKIKYQINKVSSLVSKLVIRRELIIEAEKDLQASKAEMDLEQLRQIYQQASNHMNNIQKTFDDLVRYHNQMVLEKVKFLKKELPELELNINKQGIHLKSLLAEEAALSAVISKSDSFEELEKLIYEINTRYGKKGEYESIIKQLEEVEANIKNYTKQLNEIDDALFSHDFEQKLIMQLNKFNQYFAAISNELYDERYALTYDIATNRKNQRLYKFRSFNTNISSGKKQGEISCFDIAYVLFADEENMPCLHFLLNDKKELMHDNQLIKIGELAKKHNIQFVASILKDKLPPELNDEKYFAVKLSQENKLFKIESRPPQLEIL